MTGPVADDEKRRMSRIRWRNFFTSQIVMIVGFGGAWLGHGIVQRRFALALTPALQISGVASFACAWLLVILFKRLTTDREINATPRMRWLLFERALASERRWRPWLAGLTILTALPFVMELVFPDTRSSGPVNWSLANLTLPCLSLLAPARRKGVLHDEGLQAERGDAIRLGYMVILALAIVTSIANNYWPGDVARFWPLIIILGVLTSQVRLIMLDRHLVIEDVDAR